MMFLSSALGAAQVISINTLDERSDICRDLVYSTYHRGRALAIGLESRDLPIGGTTRTKSITNGCGQSG